MDISLTPKYSDVYTGWHMDEAEWRKEWVKDAYVEPVSYTHLRAHET